MAKPIENNQYICVGNINPAKLMSKLQSKFKLDFKVQVVHNVYCIRAPTILSDGEIEECR